MYSFRKLADLEEYRDLKELGKFNIANERVVHFSNLLSSNSAIRSVAF